MMNYFFTLLVGVNFFCVSSSVLASDKCIRDLSSFLGVNQELAGYIKSDDPKVQSFIIKEYRTTAILGHGVYGVVFQVIDSKGKPFVLKQFEFDDEIAMDIKLMKLLKRKEYPIINVHSVDIDEMVAIFDYIEGVDLEILKESYKELGITRKKYLSLDREYLEMVKSYMQNHRDTELAREVSFRDFNVLYDFEADRIVIIDPR